MERVRTLKNVPGLLKEGDILISPGEGEDFVMYEKTKNSERKATIDYYTVCDNIPIFFTWDIQDEEKEPDEYLITRSGDEIAERMRFFRDQLGTFRSDEETVVYNNLIWFMDWLTGKTELLK